MSKEKGKNSPKLTDEKDTIDASPAKAFFVWMITRDIELQDAILDLLDNCVDGIRRTGAKTRGKPYAGRYAHITFDETQFCIEDNQILPKCHNNLQAIHKALGFQLDRNKKVSAGMLKMYVSFYRHYPHFGRVAL